jgi:suppressor of tumorigenicity protein 13
LPSFVFFPGNLDEAIDHLTEAIMLNPISSILYAMRGRFSFLQNDMLSNLKSNFQFSFDAWPYPVTSLFSQCPKMLFIFPASVFVKLKKPHAAIRDADAALAVSLWLSPFHNLFCTGS